MRLHDSLFFIHKHYKAIILITTFILLLGIFFVGAGDGTEKVDASNYNVKYFKCIEIESDDTLWSIAQENISEEYSSIEEYIEEVKSINNLNDY